MKHFLDTQIKGHALIFDGPLDLVVHAEKANRITPFHRPKSIRWPGREGHGYTDMVKFLHSAWPEARDRIKTIAQRLRTADLPMPKSLKRKPRWSDTDGEIDTDRLMHGEPEYLRRVKRELSVGPSRVALVSNLDLTSTGRCNPTGVFFRSSCCIALADILEELGYTVEIWLWCRGEEVYPKPYHKQFVACCPKKAGDPVDYDALCDAMSSWFTTEAIFGAFAACPERPVGLGDAVECNYDTTLLAECGIGKWAKYLDIEENTVAIPIAMITGWSVEDGYTKAVKVAHAVLERLITLQS